MRCKLLHSKAKVPTKGKPEDAGWDLCAVEDFVLTSLFNEDIHNDTIRVDENGKLYSLEKKAGRIRTGVALEIPRGYYGSIRDRSSMGSNLIKVLGGVIDPNYRGELVILLANLSRSDYHIKQGDKVAQIVFMAYEDFPHGMEVVDELSESTRGTKGFGSSGV